MSPRRPILPVPDDRPDLLEAAVRLAAGSRAPHRVVRVATDGLEDALRSSPVPLSTMGRGFDEDPAAFLSAAAAGRHAARLAAVADDEPAGSEV